MNKEQQNNENGTYIKGNSCSIAIGNRHIGDCHNKEILRMKKNSRLYDEYHVSLYLKKGKELSAIDLDALDEAMVATFKTFIHQFKKRGLSLKLDVKISK